MTDTAPNTPPEPETLDGYEPPVEGETTRDRRNRKMRNRRRAEKAAAENAPPAAVAKGGRPSKSSKRADSVTGILTIVGITVMPFDEFDGTTIIEGAADLGQALSNVADKNANVARALDALAETSSWAEVALAVAGIAVPIARHHATKRPAKKVASPADTTSPDTAAAPNITDTEAGPVFRAIHDQPTPEPVPTFRAVQ
jgi:hypothetical protein